MKSKGKKRVFNKKVGFTIIELLTVMSIIVILISLLVPSLTAVRRYAREVRQKGQFHDIGKGLTMFSIDFDGYPDSSYRDFANPRQYYCGAMKLCEAMVGQDGLGFHPDSVFRIDGLDKTGTYALYPRTGRINRRERKMPYIDIDKYKICSVEDLFTAGTNYFTGEDSNNIRLLCDVFYKYEGQRSGEKLGMPVLYYKADVTKLDNYDTGTFVDPPTNPYDPNNTYNYVDNWYLMAMWVPGQIYDHPMHRPSDISSEEGPVVFHRSIMNKKVTAAKKAYNEDSYILISAGFDGLYGTRDDIFNFAD